MENSLHYESVNHAHQVIEAINQLRKKRELCDIILRCSDQTIAAHKLILSVNSPYFRSLMNTRYYLEPGLYEHRLTGVNGKSVQDIVEYFYTSAVSVNDETVWTLLPAACKLHVVEIQTLCSDFLISQMQLENSLKIHKLATECLCSNLLKESTEFIKENFDKLLEEDCFLDLDFEDAMPHLKRLGDTGISNEQVLQAIKCWIIAAVDERQVYGYKIINMFPSLTEKLEEFIPLEYLEPSPAENGTSSSHGDDSRSTSSEKPGSSNKSGQSSVSQTGTPTNAQMGSSSIKQENSQPQNLMNGKQEEIYMCSECAEEFDSSVELHEHVKTHKVFIKSENMSPETQNSTRKDQNLTPSNRSPATGSHSPTPNKFTTPPRSFSPYEDFLKMNNSSDVSRGLSLVSTQRNNSTLDEDSSGSYFDNYMRARGLDSPNFGQRYSRSPTPNLIRPPQTKQLTVTVTSGSADGSDLNYICPVCGKSYLDKDSLSRHYETHNQFSCHICGRSYSTKSNLQTHLKKHSEDKGYSCSTCDKTFTSPSVLKTHLRTHTGEKPFACPTCGVAFAKNIHLKRHLSIHTGIKPHECKICNKRFSRSDHLKRHVQSIHTQDRPHICSLCGKDFVRKYELNKHMKQFHWGFTVGEDGGHTSVENKTDDISFNDSSLLAEPLPTSSPQLEGPLAKRIKLEPQ